MPRNAVLFSFRRILYAISAANCDKRVSSVFWGQRCTENSDRRFLVHCIILAQFYSGIFKTKKQESPEQKRTNIQNLRMNQQKKNSYTHVSQSDTINSNNDNLAIPFKCNKEKSPYWSICCVFWLLLPFKITIYGQKQIRYIYNLIYFYIIVEYLPIFPFVCEYVRIYTFASFSSIGFFVHMIRWWWWWWSMGLNYVIS